MIENFLFVKKFLESVLQLLIIVLKFKNTSNLALNKMLM